MAINPAMLVLSAANPGLLPLALGMGHAQNQAAAFGNYGGAQHRHSGHIEHSARPGVGEELRGIAVDPARAYEAYAKALAAYDALLGQHCELIDAAQARHTERAAQCAEEIRAEIEVRLQQSQKSREREDAIMERLAELDKKREKSFWGWSAEEKKEVQALKREQDRLMREFLWRPCTTRYESIGPSPREIIRREREAVESEQAVAAVAANLLHMARADVLAIHDMETGRWIEKTKLRKLIEAAQNRGGDDE